MAYRKTEVTKSRRSDFSAHFSDDETTSAPGSPRRPKTSNFKSSGTTYCRFGSSSLYYDSDDDDDYKHPRHKDDKEKEWRKDFDDDDDDDDYKQPRGRDDKEKEWREGAWLDEAIRKSMDNVERYLKEMKILMADDDYNHDEWLDIKVNVNIEIRLLDRMRKDRDDWYGTGRG